MNTHDANNNNKDNDENGPDIKSQSESLRSDKAKFNEFSPDSASAADSGTGARLSSKSTDELAVELERAISEALDYKDKYLRAVAEMENLRRRHDRERAELLKYGIEKLMKDMIPVIESFERALPDEENATNEAMQAQGATALNEYEQQFREGVKLVKRQFFDALAAQGLEVVVAKGVPFDPNVHQAIQKVESNQVQQDMVKDEFAKGYLLNGRLIRPAMVSVLVPSSGAS